MIGAEAPGHLPEGVAKAWAEVVSAYGEGWEAIAGPSLEAYCGQVSVLRDAQRRIDDEGLVVADPKGFPIPNPSIAIAKSAQEEIRKWGDAFRRRRRAVRG